MKYLLDTHTFLWWVAGDTQLSASAREVIANSDNEIFVSVVTAWEIAIKVSKKRLHLPEPPAAFMTSRLQANQFTALPIQMRHALQVAQLPHHHDDPFDRLLIAQSQLEEIPLITADKLFQQYPATIVW